MHERAGIDPPPRKWVGGSFPRPRAREFCSPAPDHPKSGLLRFRVSTPQPPYQGGLLFLTARKASGLPPDARKASALTFFRAKRYKDFAKAFFRADVRQPWNRRTFSNRLRQKVFCPDSCLEWSARALQAYVVLASCVASVFSRRGKALDLEATRAAEKHFFL